jgi:hypothetical protein
MIQKKKKQFNPKSSNIQKLLQLKIQERETVLLKMMTVQMNLV